VKLLADENTTVLKSEGGTDDKEPQIELRREKKEGTSRGVGDRRNGKRGTREVICSSLRLSYRCFKLMDAQCSLRVEARVRPVQKVHKTRATPISVQAQAI